MIENHRPFVSPLPSGICTGEYPIINLLSLTRNALRNVSARVFYGLVGPHPLVLREESLTVRTDLELIF
jgi:hypothetical protein